MPSTTTLLIKKCELQCHEREPRILVQTPGEFIAWWDNFLSENHVFYCGTITVLNPNNNVKAQVRAPNCPTRDRATQTAKILKGVGDAVHWLACLMEDLTTPPQVHTF